MQRPVILIVDDESTNIDVMASVLSNKYDLKVAFDGMQALGILSKIDVDLILLDIHMPNIDGFEVAKKIQADDKLKDIPYIFLTADVDDASIKKAFELGAKDYVTKPFSSEELRVRVENHLKFNMLQKKLSFKALELEAIIQTTKDGIAILDLETKFLFFNDSYLRMTGFTKEKLLTKRCADLSAPEDYERAIKAIKTVVVDGYVENFEKTCIVKDGKRVQVNMSMALMPDKKRIVVAAKDITEAKKKEKQLKEFISLIDKNIITSTTDVEGKITYVSEFFCKISGYTKEELLGKNHSIVRHEDTPDEVFDELWETIKSNSTWHGELKNKTKDGGFYWVDATISPIYDEEGKKVGYTALRQDITDKKHIEEISITDGLTKIYNRRHFNETLPRLINSSKRENEILSFIIMDIDHFKQYNDTYGHQKGDEALIKVAQVLKGSLKRADDHCFRLGGEEFGVLFKTDSKEKALNFADSLRQNIEESHIKHEKNSASDYLTASMGLITIDKDSSYSEDDIYKKADELLYRSKEEGRNRVSS